MNKRFKAFRLLNRRELRDLEQQFKNNAVSWNEQYAFLPLTCSLNTDPLPQNDKEMLLFTALDQPVALAYKQELTTINLCLFGNNSPCFDSVSESLMLNLISQLLVINSTQQINLNTYSISSINSIKKDEWSYHGAPTITIALRRENKNLNLYLHPQWVLNLLQQLVPPLQKPKIDLQNALNSQIVQCQVESKVFSLKVKDTINLQVGDVIQTDHPLSSALFLNHQQQSLCLAAPGSTKLYKSIQIVSSL